MIRGAKAAKGDDLLLVVVCVGNVDLVLQMGKGVGRSLYWETEQERSIGNHVPSRDASVFSLFFF